jgi:hypothetical protein
MERKNILKESERSSLNSPPPSADVENECRYTSTPPYAFIFCTEKNLPFTGGKKKRRSWWIATV